MTARTVSAADPVIVDAAFEPRPEKVAKGDNNAMMAGADMYRRMQTRPKGPPTGLILGGVAAIALIAGGAYFATQGTGKTTAPAQVAANTAISANQQAQTSDAAAQTSLKSAQANDDAAQAKAVAATGAPPASATDTAPAPKPVRTVTRTHDTVVRHTVVARQTRPSSSAASSGVDASAIVAAPPPVTTAQPAPAPQAAPPFSVPIPAPAPAQPATPPQ